MWTKVSVRQVTAKQRLAGWHLSHFLWPTLYFASTLQCVRLYTWKPDISMSFTFYVSFQESSVVSAGSSWVPLSSWFFLFSTGHFHFLFPPFHCLLFQKKILLWLSFLSLSQPRWSSSSSLGSPGQECLLVAAPPSLCTSSHNAASPPPSQHLTILLNYNKDKCCCFPWFWVTSTVSII